MSNNWETEIGLESNATGPPTPALPSSEEELDITRARQDLTQRLKKAYALARSENAVELFQMALGCAWSICFPRWASQIQILMSELESTYNAAAVASIAEQLSELTLWPGVMSTTTSSLPTTLQEHKSSAVVNYGRWIDGLVQVLNGWLPEDSIEGARLIRSLQERKRRDVWNIWVHALQTYFEDDPEEHDGAMALQFL